ncbi:MAG: hypothetical protein Kow0062_23680 [Acidobacteriota bacterium]
MPNRHRFARCASARRRPRRAAIVWAALAAFVVAPSLPGAGASGAASSDAGHAGLLSPHFHPLALAGGYVYVANTPAGTVDVIATATNQVVDRIRVGLEPVSLAVRPDGRELWVANHVSDTVSVIDLDATRATYRQVIATVQDLDPTTKATRFDEPVGIAFASDAKAYVALSSEDRIAIVDVATRTVTGHLDINAQDPRAIAVHGGHLYVLPFESNNQTQLSGCLFPVLDPKCTFDVVAHVLEENDVLSEGYVSDLIREPAIPDRDLYVFDTGTDTLVEIVETVGTLLYGIAVDSAGRIFVAQTDARNDANGLSGTQGHGLAELENRAFLNRVTVIGGCESGGCGAPSFIELEPLPPANPAPGMALATPFGIAVSPDDALLVATAAGSHRLFTMDPATGTVLGRVDVGAVPRGVALEADGAGAATHAWVLNAVEDSVSRVDLSDPAAPAVTATIPLDDPTDPAFRQGRILFNDAGASSTGTFSCASCHPDGHTDQLLWVLDTPKCNLSPFPSGPGCDQIVARSTMPIRGLRDTEPYHWDGIPGDPYGGNNVANVWGSDPPNCERGDALGCARVLVDGALGSTMCDQADCPVNDEGKSGFLTGAQRDALARFILGVPYPPARDRAYTDELSAAARDGFRAFHVDTDPDCGNCHRMPFWVSTGTVGTGMDAPTWRGAYDRWLILPQGRLNVLDAQNVLETDVENNGFVERTMWGIAGATDEIWQMVEEGSTGWSGAFARSLTLGEDTAGAAQTADLLDALEGAAGAGAVVLEAEGVFVDGTGARPVELQYRDPFGPLREGLYVERGAGLVSYTRDELVSQAAAGSFVGTFTAWPGAGVAPGAPQPALWTLSEIQAQAGQQIFPRLSGGATTMTMSARHVLPGARLWVDGRRVPGTISCETGGTLPGCDGETVVVRLASLPAATGLHFLRVQNPDGLFSNDMLFHSDDAPTDCVEAVFGLLSDLLADADFARSTCLGRFEDSDSVPLAVPTPPAGYGYYHLHRDDCASVTYGRPELDAAPQCP